MLEVLYATGMRVTELISLEISDINMEMEYLSCKNGEKTRIIPLGSKALEALDEYLRKARMSMLRDEREKTLFVNCFGHPMTRQGFWKIIKVYAKKAGIKAFLCGASYRKRRRPSGRAGNDGTFRHFHNTDVCQTE